ncbi:MAG TPA: site-2 protease family protein [Syntrophorhabdaceae bacterium]|jgi:regulator of sigma E protease
MQIAISFMAFMAVFTVVVLVHELGHFIAARRSGIKVYEFSIGFPFSPRLFTLFRHRETEFTLRLLPLGGFVSFSRDDVTDDAKALLETSHAKRVLIMSAGSLFNIAFALILFIPLFMAGKHLGFLDAVSLSFRTFWEALAGTVMFLVNMVSGHGALGGVSGPIGIAAMAGKAATRGMINLLYFTGVLSLSLGIMNLIPFPALDGGQLAMVFGEWIRKKPFSPRTYQVTTLAGLALFALLTAIISIKDIMRLVA